MDYDPDHNPRPENPDSFEPPPSAFARGCSLVGGMVVGLGFWFSGLYLCLCFTQSLHGGGIAVEVWLLSLWLIALMATLTAKRIRRGLGYGVLLGLGFVLLLIEACSGLNLYH